MSSIPSLLVIIVVWWVIGPGLHTIIIAIAFFAWITMARVARAQVLQLKVECYARRLRRSLGSATGVYFFHHLLPNAYGPILVTLTLTVPSAILRRLFSAILDLGVQAPIASWGTIRPMRGFRHRNIILGGCFSAALIQHNDAVI